LVGGSGASEDAAGAEWKARIAMMEPAERRVLEEIMD
jgi:hypothetical protein